MARRDAPSARRCRRPRSLFGRLMLIWLLGTSVIVVASLMLFYGDRGRTARGHVFEQIAADIVTVVWLLDAQAPAQRAATIARLQEQRPRYRFALAPLPPGHALDAEYQHPAWAKMSHQLADRPLELRAAQDERHHRPILYLGTRLADGTPFLVEAAPPQPSVPPWRSVAPFVFFVLGLALLTWLGVRLITRPLRRLATAATALGDDLERPPLPEDGPEEVRHASRAFNHMQERIRSLFAERTRILAAVTHDLKTPMTRLRLRAEMLDDAAAREKILADLAEMAGLVSAGLAYAKSMSPSAEAVVAVQLDALLEALVADYRDSRQAVSLRDSRPMTRHTRPQMLRRLLANLIDNALKFAGQATLSLSDEGGAVLITVSDEGPGIPETELSKVFEPFYRVEASRNPAGGGTGLGLAIARQLARALEVDLSLRNLPTGGLQARVRLPARTEK